MTTEEENANNTTVAAAATTTTTTTTIQAPAAESETKTERESPKVTVPPSVDPIPQQQSQDQQIEKHIKRVQMLADEDPLLISQSLTYVTDDGSVLHSFLSAPLSTGFKVQLILLEVIMIVLMIAAVPIGAHGTVVGACIFNLIVLAFFWYNLVRSVDITADGTLRFWIGNIEVDVPFDKIVSVRRVSTRSPCSCCLMTMQPYRGFLSVPNDGVAIATTVPSTPFWLWPRSAGRPERRCCFFPCPRLTIVFSPSGGSQSFIREVENEMRNFSTGKLAPSRASTTATPMAAQADFLDV